MSNTGESRGQKILVKIKYLFRHPLKTTGRFLWHGSWWRKGLMIFLAFIFFITAGMYGIAEWYIHKHAGEPLTLGTTFIPEYAESFGLNPKDTLSAILGDLNVKQIRLVSYWEDIEPTPGVYDFSSLDWQFAMANQHGAKVSLAIGLRQPRWPECHQPSWVNNESKNTWEPQLNNFITAVINHYKNNPALQNYELENEFFMKVFGECKDFDRNRLISEFDLVKRADPNHLVMISRSDNWMGLPVGKPTPDFFGISIYKRVWDATITHRYFEYPLPTWFYSALAGAGEIITGKNMVIHELQAEPWPPKGQSIVDTPLSEQFKSMNAERIKTRIDYGEKTGMKSIDLWGAEWWYWLKVKKNDPGVWNVVKDAVTQASTGNQKLAQ
jgi:hypothetical protein